MLYLINPKRKGGRMAARRKKRATPAQLRALAKARRAKKAKAAGKKSKRRRPASTTRKRRKTTTRRKPVARRRKRSTRRRTTARRAPKRRGARRRRKSITFRPVRGRAYTRNPRFTIQRAMRDLQRGVVDASAVVIGKVGTRMVAGFLPFGGQGAMALAKQAIAALVVGMAANQFIPGDYGRFVLAGGLAAPIETFMQGIPVIGPAITGGGALGEYMGMGQPLPIGSYVDEGVMTEQDVPMGEYVEMFP